MTRGELYQKFGPKLLEAQSLVIKDEINLIRVEFGLSERTNAQIIRAISDKLKAIPDYPWMSEM